MHSTILTLSRVSYSLFSASQPHAQPDMYVRDKIEQSLENRIH